MVRVQRVQFEVILVNLLYYNNSVDRGDIHEYCNKANERVIRETGGYLRFETDDRAIKRALRIYGDVLKDYNGEYLLKKPFNPDYFDSHFNEEIRNILKEVPKELKKEEQ